MIPEVIRDYDTYIVAYSGGKDSTATLLWALEHLLPEKIRVVFHPSGADWPETLEYIEWIEGRLDFPILRVQAGDFELPESKRATHTYFRDATDLWELIKGRGKWPGAKYRFCTTYIKRWPMKLFAQTQPNPVLIYGQRHEESAKRAKLPTFSPKGVKETKRIGFPIFRPVLKWSERCIFEYLKRHDIEPNPVYRYPHITRVGCWCCIMAGFPELVSFARIHPEIAERAARLEQEIDHYWRCRRLSVTNALIVVSHQTDMGFEVADRLEQMSTCRPPEWASCLCSF